MERARADNDALNVRLSGSVFPEIGSALIGSDHREMNLVRVPLTSAVSFFQI